MTDLLLGVVGWLCVLGGGFFTVTGGIGLLRLPDFYTRIHAASMTESLGAALILLGLMTQAGATLTTVKLLLILVFTVFTSPTATHALAKAALHGQLQPLTHHDRGPEGP